MTRPIETGTSAFDDTRGARSEGLSPGARLLSPSQAAAYLGLGSRFAIYRLVASGQLPVVRLANKLRIDLRDLDAAIEEAKRGVAAAHLSALKTGPRRPNAIPRELAPRRRRGETR